MTKMCFLCFWRWEDFQHILRFFEFLSGDGQSFLRSQLACRWQGSSQGRTSPEVFSSISPEATSLNRTSNRLNLFWCWTCNSFRWNATAEILVFMVAPKENTFWEVLWPSHCTSVHKHLIGSRLGTLWSNARSLYKQQTPIGKFRKVWTKGSPYLAALSLVPGSLSHTHLHIKWPADSHRWGSSRNPLPSWEDAGKQAEALTLAIRLYSNSTDRSKTQRKMHIACVNR